MWQRLAGSSANFYFFLPHHIARLHFLASLAIRSSHVTVLANGCGQRQCLPLPGLAIKNLSLDFPHSLPFHVCLLDVALQSKLEIFMLKMAVTLQPGSLSDCIEEMPLSLPHPDLHSRLLTGLYTWKIKFYFLSLCNCRVYCSNLPYLN